MSPQTRLGLFYSAFFLGYGASLPYMPIWFAARGLTGAEIGLILSLPMLARLVTAPLMAVWADSFALRRTPLMIMAVGSAGLYALLAAPFGFGWQLALWFLAASVFTMTMPLMDVLTLNRSRRHGFNFGLPRGMGSAAFILSNVGIGFLLTRARPDLVLVWTVVCAALTAVAARALLPDDPVDGDGEARPGAAARFAGVGELIRDKAFMTAVVSVGLIQSAHAFYYGFSALAWKAQGLPESMTGLLWGFAVTAEVGFMWFMEPWRRAIGPRRLLVLGGVAAVVRWSALAFSPPLWVLFPLQVLHALTYAATFLASLQIVDRLATPRTASAAQAINSALSSGALAGLATIGSGWLYDHYGPRSYLLMAAMAALGAMGAVRLFAVRRLDPDQPRV